MAKLYRNPLYSEDYYNDVELYFSLKEFDTIKGQIVGVIYSKFEVNKNSESYQQHLCLLLISLDQCPDHRTETSLGVVELINIEKWLKSKAKPHL